MDAYLLICLFAYLLIYSFIYLLTYLLTCLLFFPGSERTLRQLGSINQSLFPMSGCAQFPRINQLRCRFAWRESCSVIQPVSQPVIQPVSLPLRSWNCANCSFTRLSLHLRIPSRYDGLATELCRIAKRCFQASALFHSSRQSKSMASMAVMNMNMNKGMNTTKTKAPQRGFLRIPVSVHLSIGGASSLLERRCFPLTSCDRSLSPDQQTKRME